MDDGKIDKALKNANFIALYLQDSGMENSAKDIRNILQYAKALDKNQKSFIQLILCQKRILKEQQKTLELCNKAMTRKQKRTVARWLKEGGKNVSTRTD